MKTIFIFLCSFVFLNSSQGSDKFSYQEALKYFQDRDKLPVSKALKFTPKKNNTMAAPALDSDPIKFSNEIRIPGIKAPKRFFETSLSLGGFIHSQHVIPEDLNLELRLRLSQHGGWSTWLELGTLMNSASGEARLAALQKLRYSIGLSSHILALFEGGLGVSYTDDKASLKSWQRPWDQAFGATYRFGGSKDIQLSVMIGRRGAFAWTKKHSQGDIYMRWTLGFQF